MRCCLSEIFCKFSKKKISISSISLDFFTVLAIFIMSANKNGAIANNMDKQYKRQYRELDTTTKQKISNSSKGKSKSETHKQHISQALKDYWRNVPNKPQSDDEHLTMDDYLAGR